MLTNMQVDERNLPALLIFFLAVLFLLFAFCNNFLPHEIITLSYYENEDVDAGKKNSMYQTQSNNFIIVDYTVLDNILLDTYFELTGHKSYIIEMPSTVKENIKISLHNTSNTYKSIEFKDFFYENGLQKTKMFTLKSHQKVDFIYKSVWSKISLK